MKYSLNPNPKISVKVYGGNLRISRRSSGVICKNISGKNLQKNKARLERVLTGKDSFDGKYFNNATTEILRLLNAAEKNAEFKGLDTDRLVTFASAHQGFKFYTPRRFKLRRRQRKVCNVQIVLVQK